MLLVFDSLLSLNVQNLFHVMRVVVLKRGRIPRWRAAFWNCKNFAHGVSVALLTTMTSYNCHVGEFHNC